MNTALTTRPKSIQRIDVPKESMSLEPATGLEMPAIARPPKIAYKLDESVPSGVTGRSRIQWIANKLFKLDELARLAMRQHLEQLVNYMIHNAASDMDAGGPASNGFVWYRIEGRKAPCEALGEHAASVMDVLILSLLTEAQFEELLTEYAIDFSMDVAEDGAQKAQRYRVSVYFDELNLAINVRAIQRELRALDSLGFHPMVERGLLFSNVRDGLTLITGVTGSGKSTTLDSIIDANNRQVEGHIVVMGNPVEYVHKSDRCIIRHREVGKGVASFKAGVIQSMRQDPDMIVIGEMRDADTISATLEVTDSGHRVFSTLHTRSAVESIDRIIAEYPSEEQERIRHRLADVLRCIISQKLCPKIGGGLVLAKEVLWITPAIRAAIKNGNLSEIYQMMWEGNQKGQVTLEQDLLMLIRRGLISRETALSYANNKKRMQQVMR